MNTTIDNTYKLTQLPTYNAEHNRVTFCVCYCALSLCVPVRRLNNSRVFCLVHARSHARRLCPFVLCCRCCCCCWTTETFISHQSRTQLRRRPHVACEHTKTHSLTTQNHTHAAAYNVVHMLCVRVMCVGMLHIHTAGWNVPVHNMLVCWRQQCKHKAHRRRRRQRRRADDVCQYFV